MGISWGFRLQYPVNIQNAMETIVVSRSEMIYMFGESCPCECLLESMHHYASNLRFIFWVRSKDGLEAISALLKLFLAMAVPQR
jgi:hypothetical protein